MRLLLLLAVLLLLLPALLLLLAVLLLLLVWGRCRLLRETLAVLRLPIVGRLLLLRGRLVCRLLLLLLRDALGLSLVSIVRWCLRVLRLLLLLLGVLARLLWLLLLLNNSIPDEAPELADVGCCEVGDVCGGWLPEDVGAAPVPEELLVSTPSVAVPDGDSPAEELLPAAPAAPTEELAVPADVGAALLPSAMM